VGASPPEQIARVKLGAVRRPLRVRQPSPNFTQLRRWLLTKDELRSFLDAIPSLKYRAALMAAYAGGLRLSEVLHLRVQDIDSKNMRLFVHQGKGRVDRVVMLSNNLLVVLRAYWTVFRPPTSSFPAGRRISR
jgi:integrase